MFFRAIFYLIAGVLIIGVLRAVIGAIGKLFSEAVLPEQANSAGKTRQPTAPTVESLQKDPVCGAFVAPSAAVQVTIAGTRHYFCSAECRDKFKAA